MEKLKLFSQLIRLNGGNKAAELRDDVHSSGFCSFSVFEAYREIEFVAQIL